MKRKITLETCESDSTDSKEDLSQKIKSMDLQADDSDYCEEQDQENSDSSQPKTVKSSLKLNSNLGTKALGMSRRFIPIIRDQTFKPLPRVGIKSAGIQQTNILKPFSIPKFTAGRSHLAGGVRYGNTLGMRRSAIQRRGPLHDPEEEGAIVLYVPKVILSVAQQFSMTFKKDSNEPEGEVHVVINPILGKVLRPHQIEVE